MVIFSQGMRKTWYLLPWLSPPQHGRPLPCKEGEDQLAPCTVCPSFITQGLAQDLLGTLLSVPVS